MKFWLVIIACFFILSCQRVETEVWVYDDPGEFGWGASRGITFDDWVVIIYDEGYFVIADKIGDISKVEPLIRLSSNNDVVFLTRLDEHHQYDGQVGDLFKNGFEDTRTQSIGGKEIYFEGRWYKVSGDIGKQFIIVDGEKRGLIRNPKNAMHFIVQ